MTKKMITLLIIISCIETLTASKVKQWLPFGGREYYFGIDLINYTQAEQECSVFKAGLVAIYNKNIQMFLRDTIVLKTIQNLLSASDKRKNDVTFNCSADLNVSENEFY